MILNNQLDMYKLIRGTIIKTMRKLVVDVLERLLDEARGAASPEYMKKEKVRQELQDLLTSKVRSGEITSQGEIVTWCETAKMAVDALKYVPIEGFSAQIGKTRR